MSTHNLTSSTIDIDARSKASQARAAELKALWASIALKIQHKQRQPKRSEINWDGLCR